MLFWLKVTWLIVMCRDPDGKVRAAASGSSGLNNDMAAAFRDLSALQDSRGRKLQQSFLSFLPASTNRPLLSPLLEKLLVLSCTVPDTWSAIMSTKQILELCCNLQHRQLAVACLYWTLRFHGAWYHGLGSCECQQRNFLELSGYSFERLPYSAWQSIYNVAVKQATIPLECGPLQRQLPSLRPIQQRSPQAKSWQNCRVLARLPLQR